MDFRSASPRFAPRWPCTEDSVNRAPSAGIRCSGIVYAENECNYCAHCQTGGKVLADRALSRLLHKSWPRTLDDVG